MREKLLGEGRREGGKEGRGRGGLRVHAPAKEGGQRLSPEMMYQLENTNGFSCTTPS